MKIKSDRGVITTPHHLASAAGLRILNEGGTAIDAMLAAGATLAVVYPHMTGIGGDAIWMIHSGDQDNQTSNEQVRCIMGIGQSGQKLPSGDTIHLRGPTAVATTAGAMASWQNAHQISTEQWKSQLDWPELLADAIHWAEQGVPISKSQAFWQKQRAKLIADLPDLTLLATHADSNAFLQAGEILKQPRLAATLRTLASNGVMDFYQGGIAQALAEGFANIECGLTLTDLMATRAPIVKPLSIRYRDGHFYNFPPPTQGLYTLQAMLALQSFSIAEMENGSADYFHALVESIKPALQRRNRELHDPLPEGWDFESSLTTDAGRQYAAAINPKQATDWVDPGRPADTVWLSATDAEGRTACLMQSLFHDFGSGCMIGDTGVLWQNRAASFQQNPAHPNHWAPGKRPAHTLNPSCYLADDGQRYFFGTQGGDGQPQTQLVIATQLIDFKQELDQALLAPRFLQGRSFFDSTDNLKLEENIAFDVRTELTNRGHQVETIPALSPFTGQAGVISISPKGKRCAMHDPRGEGNALCQSKL